MIKRTTFLAKRTELTSQQFGDHWRGVHADIAAKFVGLAAYNQNHVIQRLDPGLPTTFFLDGIVELWFDESAGDRPGRDPAITAALVEDEPRFLRGLSGAAVEPPVLYAKSRYKFWILGHWATEPDPEQLATAASVLQSRFSDNFEVHVQIADSGHAFTRDALEVDPSPPEVALIVLLGEEHPTAHQRTTLENFLSSRVIPLTDVVSVLSLEERIVPADPDEAELETNNE